MKAIVTATVLALFVTAAAKAEENAPELAYVNCLANTVEKLDDGRSDAQTIAMAVASDCALKREQVSEGLTPGDAEFVRSSELGVIISLVLESRKRRSGRK